MSEYGSRRSGPAMTLSTKAASSTLRAIGPTWSSIGFTPAGHIGTRAKFGLIPTSPVNEQGFRIEPPPSVPIAIGVTPAATEATAPPLEPPAVSVRFQGWRGAP